MRGFDIDHGTDIAISVDGMPVNMVSHAHGQVYADLQFVILETVENIDFGKETYYANKGDFATTGYVTFQTKDKIGKSCWYYFQIISKINHIAVDNIFDTAWNETQFATESRLKNEAVSVEEIHFTPGTPFYAKGKITYTS